MKKLRIITMLLGMILSIYYIYLQLTSIDKTPARILVEHISIFGILFVLIIVLSVIDVIFVKK